MSTGSLLYPIGYIFLDDNGSPVNAGRLYAYRTGTSTAQDTFSDSTLSTPNANPVVLNSSGRSTTAIYGDPSSGFDYRLKLTTSADSQIWQYDDIVVDGADTATFAEGTFTGTLTGMDASTTGTVNYKIVSNSAGTGKHCTLTVPTTISGTSNTTAMTMTGLPAACSPSIAATVPVQVVDNGGSYIGLGQITASSTTITFFIDQPFTNSGFTGSGTKGVTGGWTMSYNL